MAKPKVKEEMVYIELPISEINKNDDLFVSVNSYTCIIKRGVRVQVPASVAEVVNRMLSQDTKTLRMVGDLENTYQNRMKNL